MLDANSGEPLADVDIKTWYRENNNQVVDGESGKTDKNGLFKLPARRNKQYVLLATHKDQQLSSGTTCTSITTTTIRSRTTQTVFFTDRSLYRPGQTVQYKGICIQVDQQSGQLRDASPNRNVTVVFNDANGKEIAGKPRTTNDYGSFSGSFTAPRDRLIGQMSSVPRRAQRRDELQRRGVQAAEVPSEAGRAEGRRQAERRGQRARQGDCLHRRGQSAAPRSATASSAKCATPTGGAMYCWWRHADTRQPGDRPRHRPSREPTARFTIDVHRQARPDACRRRTSRRSTTPSPPT